LKRINDVDVHVDGSRADSESSADSSATSSSSAESGAEASSSSGGNVQNVTVTEQNPDDVTIRNVSSPDTPNVYPSAPCRIAVSAGLSLAGGTLSGGGSYEDPECTLRETARVFQFLGVPEMGLLLLCKNSVVVTGRKNKKGELESSEPNPIGSDECVRLVREFQRDSDEPDATGTLQTEIAILREQQDNLEQRFAEKVEEVEREHRVVQEMARSRPATVVEKEVVQEPFLNDQKRAKLNELLEESEK
jgi:hypothetical protein